MSQVSIIVPAYNAATILPETINSVLAQTYEDWEMLIIDDCSTDNTYQVALSFAEKDDRILVLQNEKNSGVAFTRNTGIAAAKGKFIAFLDSDDLWLPDKLEKQVAFMEKNGHALTYTAYQKFDTNSGERGKVISAPKKMTARKILGNTAIGCLTVMVNVDITGPFKMPLIKHTEDNVTWQEILSRGYTAYGINEVLALYREGNVSLTSNKASSVKLQWSTYRDYYKFSFVKSAFLFACYLKNAVLKHFF